MFETLNQRVKSIVSFVNFWPFGAGVLESYTYIFRGTLVFEKLNEDERVQAVEQVKLVVSDFNEKLLSHSFQLINQRVVYCDETLTPGLAFTSSQNHGVKIYLGFRSETGICPTLWGEELNILLRDMPVFSKKTLYCVQIDGLEIQGSCKFSLAF